MAYATNFITRTWAYDYSLAIQDIEQEFTLEDRKDLQPFEKGEPIKKTAIDIYEERVKGWFLEPARNLLKTDPHSGFVALMVVIGFFEPHAYYLEGISADDSKRKPSDEKSSGELFRICFLEVMRAGVDILGEGSEKKEVIEKVAKHIYRKARNGLFHNLMIRNGIGLSGNIPFPIVFGHYKDNQKHYFVSFNTLKCLDRLEQYFDEYINALRDSNNKELRNNFMIAWNSSHPLQQSVEKKSGTPEFCTFVNNIGMFGSPHSVNNPNDTVSLPFSRPIKALQNGYLITTFEPEAFVPYIDMDEWTIYEE